MKFLLSLFARSEPLFPIAENEAHSHYQLSESVFWCLYGLLAVLSGAILFIATDILPITDLPEHILQIYLWQGLDAGNPVIRKVYEYNPNSPYWLFYQLVRFISETFSISVLNAFKIIIFLAVLSIPLLLKLLATQLAFPNELALLGFSLGFGYAYNWGLLTYFISIPIGLYAFYRFIAFCREISIKTFIHATIAALLLMLVHSISFVMVFGVIGLMSVWHVAKKRNAVPLLLTSTFFFIFLLWNTILNKIELPSSKTTIYAYKWSRIYDWLGHSLFYDKIPGVSDLGILTNWPMAIALICISMCCFRRNSKKHDYTLICFGFALLCYLFLPLAYAGIFLINTRIAIWIVIFFIFMMHFPKDRLRQWISASAAIVLSLGFLGFQYHAHASFADEFKRFEEVVSEIPENGSLLMLIYKPHGEWTIGYPFVHAGAWLNPSGNYELSYSFSEESHMPVRIKDKRRMRKYFKTIWRAETIPPRVLIQLPFQTVIARGMDESIELQFRKAMSGKGTGTIKRINDDWHVISLM